MDLPPTHRSCLPPQMRVLFVAGEQRVGCSLAGALAADIDSRVILEEANGTTAALRRLRDELFDAVLIGHEEPHLDALQLLDAIRTGGSEDQPVIVLGELAEEEMTVLCYESGADAYLCVARATARMLIWEIGRAMHSRRLHEENRRLEQQQRRWVSRERGEALRLLEQQRTAVIAHRPSSSQNCWTQSEPELGSFLDLTLPVGTDLIVQRYHDLLRTYVVMGSGNLSGEVRDLVWQLADADVSGSQIVLIHLHVLEQVVDGLGSRSARHVMNRADLLILEVLVQIADHFHQRYQNATARPEQQLLPGFLT